MSQLQAHYFLKNGSAINMAVDASGGPVVYDLTYAEFRTLNVLSIEFYIESTSRLDRYENFWTLQNPLVAGINMSVTTQQQTFDGPILKSNRDILENFDVSNDFVNRTIDPRKQSLRSSFKITEGGLVLSSGGSNQFSVTLNDDLSDLDYMSFSLKGLVLI